MTTQFETADAAPKADGHGGSSVIRLAVDPRNANNPRKALEPDAAAHLGRRSKSRRSLCSLAMVLADAAGFAIGLVVIGTVGQATAMAPALAGIGAAVLCLNGLAGLYPCDRLHAQEILRRRTLTILLAAVLIAGVMGVALADWHAAATAEAFLLLAVVLQVPIRKIVRKGLHQADLWGTPTDFHGAPDQTKDLEAYFARNWQFGLIPAQGRGEIAATSYMPTSAEAQQLRLRYRDVLVLANLPDMRVSGLIPADLGGAIGLWLGRSPPGRPRAMKRVIDLSIALPALIVATPVVLIASALIWAVDPGPVHYVQKREGFRGSTLRVLKLRTMYRDAETRLLDLLRNNPAARAEWQSHFKLRNDPRVLPGIGRFLRVSSIDELPQLINVIRGEMSIVGPRPFPDYHLAAMPVEFRAKRCSVVPGITGLWQISARSEADIALQQQLDEHYIDNQSIWLDLQIVLGTFAALVGRKGAY